MKKSFKTFAKYTTRISFFVILLMLNPGAFGQSYNYNVTSGTLGTTYSWIDCSGGSNITSGDDVRGSINWPFSFEFYGTTYTTSNTLSVCTNGFIRTDAAASTDWSLAQNYILSSSSTELGRIIALAVYDGKVGDNGGWIRSNLSGSSPFRVFTIEYNNLEVNYSDDKYVDVQVSFYETTNKIVLKLGVDDISKTGVDMGIHSGTSGYFHKWQEIPTTATTNNNWIEYSIPNEVFTGSISSPVASGATITVPYTTQGYYNPGNTFTAQLSDASGSFANPVNIGSVSAQTSGSISATIPLNTLTGTGYRIRVISNNPSVTGTDNGSNITINNIKKVIVNATEGTTTAYYLTLKAAFDAINAGTHRGVLDVEINNNTSETSTATLNASGTASASYTNVDIYPTTTNLSVSGNINGNLIQLNGADNVRFDGRVNMEGTPGFSIINNSTGTSARTIELINSAENNAFEYLTIKGAGTGTSLGTINLSTSSAGNGNDNNVIAFCKISGISNTVRASNSIYSAGTSSRENSGNAIRNNEIFDFLSRSTNSNAILIAANSTDFTITANSFYETT